jgi:hypothetical protein
MCLYTIGGSYITFFFSCIINRKQSKKVYMGVFLCCDTIQPCHHHQQQRPIDEVQYQTIQMGGGAKNAKNSSHWTASGRATEHTSASFMHGPALGKRGKGNSKIQSSLVCGGCGIWRTTTPRIFMGILDPIVSLDSHQYMKYAIGKSWCPVRIFV